MQWVDELHPFYCDSVLYRKIQNYCNVLRVKSEIPITWTEIGPTNAISGLLVICLLGILKMYVSVTLDIFLFKVVFLLKLFVCSWYQETFFRKVKNVSWWHLSWFCFIAGHECERKKGLEGSTQRALQEARQQKMLDAGLVKDSEKKRYPKVCTFLLSCSVSNPTYARNDE